METETEKTEWLKKWLIAGRPWSLPASVIPVIFGSSLAATVGWVKLHIGLLLLSLLAMIFLHMAANMLSDVVDWRRGLDREMTPASGAIARGLLTPGQVFRGSMVFFAIGSALGLILVYLCGKLVLYTGLLGIGLGVAYPWLKKEALGDVAVFIDFGLLGSFGGWVVQTGQFSWLPVIWAIPQGLLIVAILHANNWRDILTDREKKISTVANNLGGRGSRRYYGLLLFGSMALLATFVLVPRLFGLDFPSLPLSILIVILCWPQARRLWKMASSSTSPSERQAAELADCLDLDGATARYSLIFGLLTVGGLWLDYLIEFLKK
ncbi:MAG TPA: prenyltransferase [Candidatus Saccharicenans sp.]|nr:prenyltransferase [Candidatus Saccharicenans sp.]HQO76253.1 prenyltransferase [Candidatus Saccharicenans sp.]HUM79862.1 prenyltransferase [Candidatus Saccharicenans sp.]